MSTDSLPEGDGLQQRAECILHSLPKGYVRQIGKQFDTVATAASVHYENTSEVYAGYKSDLFGKALADLRGLCTAACAVADAESGGSLSAKAESDAADLFGYLTGLLGVTERAAIVASERYDPLEAQGMSVVGKYLKSVRETMRKIAEE